MFGKFHGQGVFPINHVVHRDTQPRELMDLGGSRRKVFGVTTVQEMATNTEAVLRSHDPLGHRNVMPGYEVHGKATQQCRQWMNVGRANFSCVGLSIQCASFLAGHSIRRSSRFNILPDALRGMSSTNSTDVGHL